MKRIVPTILIAGTGFLCMGQGIINLPSTLADASAKVEGVKTGLAYSEGPAFDRVGNLYFSEMSSPQMKVWKVTPQGVATVFRTGDSFNGIECDPQGRLVFCERDKITRLNQSGGIDTLSKTGDDGFQLLTTNDLSIGATGAMFFTNHSSGRSLFYRSASGSLKRWGGFPLPNGVEWIEEKGFLYLCLSDSNMVITYSVAGDGSISSGKKFVSLSVPDGITLDERYNVYVACSREGKVYVYDSTGTTLGAITVQGTANPAGNVSNCVFGGTDNKTLYITGNGGAYRIPLLVAGRVRPGASAIIPRYLHLSGKNNLIDTYQNSAETGALFDLCGRMVGQRLFSAAAWYVRNSGKSKNRNLRVAGGER
jgi:gluconolactonase